MTSSKAPTRRYSFADLTLDAGRHALWRESAPIPLSKLTFDLLRVLVEQAPNTVAHDELADRTWGPRRAVTPECLAKRVMLLRQALGDEADHPRYIECVRGQGYRLIPEVEALHEPAAAAGEPSSADSSTPDRTGGHEPPRRRRAAVAVVTATVAVMAAVAVAAAGAWMNGGRAKPPEPEPGRLSIAVLPFENRSAAEEDAGFLAEGIHDDLITRLAAIGDLKVTPRASVMDYRSLPHSHRQIGQQLGVGVVLDGSVQRAGDMVRVNVRLVDARTEDTVWGESYDGNVSVENVFAMQRQIAAAIAAQLETRLTPEEATLLSRSPTRNRRALDFYMSGRDYERPPFAYWDIAAVQYERAVAEDPEFALAHARLSLATLLAFYNSDGDRERVERAREAADAALRLQPDLPLARVARAFYLLSVRGDLQGASQALAIPAPSEPQFFVVRAALNERLGKREEARADRAAALALSPRDPVLMLDIAIWRARARQYAEAQRLVERALDIRPDFLGATLFKAELALLRDGDPGPIRALSLEDFDADRRRRAQLQRLQWQAALYERDYHAALRALAGPDGPGWSGDLAGDPPVTIPELAQLASTLRTAGESQKARQLGEWGLARLEGAQRPWHRWRATFLAAAGKTDEAMQVVQLVLAETPSYGEHLWTVFDVLAPSGAHALAVQVLDEYLSGPGSWSLEAFLPDPRLDPIRDDPGFQTLVEKHRRRDGIG